MNDVDYRKWLETLEGMDLEVLGALRKAEMYQRLELRTKMQRGLDAIDGRIADIQRQISIRMRKLRGYPVGKSKGRE